MKQKLLAMILIGVMTVSMSACGSKGKDTGTSEEGPTSYALMDYISDKGYIILIGTDEINKDDGGYAIVLYDDGTYYSSYDGSSQHKLSTYSKMTDDEIIEDIKKQWQEHKDKNNTHDNKAEIEQLCADAGYSEYASYYQTGDTSGIIGFYEGAFMSYSNMYIGGLPTDEIYSEMSNNGFDTSVTDYLTSIYNGINLENPSEDDMMYLDCNLETIDPLIEANLLPNYISAASAACDDQLATAESGQTGASYDAGTYKITAITDASGNNVASEKIDFTDGDSKKKIELASYVPTYAIYDCYYSGYNTDTNYLGTDMIAVRVDASNDMCGFDTVDTNGITID